MKQIGQLPRRNTTRWKITGNTIQTPDGTMYEIVTKPACGNSRRGYIRETDLNDKKRYISTIPFYSVESAQREAITP